MSKLSQLEQMRRWSIPTLPFKRLTYSAFQAEEINTDGLQFPLAVRSSYQEEDSAQKSFAGHFHTALNVEEKDLPSAVTAVFDSYPQKEASEVILQNMLQPDFSGVLFAFRRGVWKLEIGAGQGAALVEGQFNPDIFLLPKFTKADTFWSKVVRFWELPEKYKSAYSALVALSFYAGRLLTLDKKTEHGADIEFAIKGKEIYLLQARPITTPGEEEELLTSANHKEILPPQPSQLMTELIVNSGEKLFQYYQKLDKSIPDRSFIIKAAGMPWINLSALLDLMVFWGLPTSLIENAIGATDCYRVSVRPHRILFKWPIFVKVLFQQLSGRKQVERWLNQLVEEEKWKRQNRVVFYENEKGYGFKLWWKDFQYLYVDLVNHMQMLTGSMSGPLELLNKLGWLSKIVELNAGKSRSSNYFEAFSALQSGNMTKKRFLDQFGHRGFYESDIGQKRFFEYDQQDWWRLLGSETVVGDIPPRKNKQTVRFAWPLKLIARLFKPAFRAVFLREQVRDELMKHFWYYRQGLIELFDGKLEDPWNYRKNELMSFLNNELSALQLKKTSYEKQSGWDLNTFLANQKDRRMAISSFDWKQKDSKHKDYGLGIYPGVIEGYVWRVKKADLDKLTPPPFANLILVADALDPGWIPYFTKVDGVIAYVGGLLSHASIILRESQIPAITQLPKSIELTTGDFIKMDGASGRVWIEQIQGQENSHQS